MTPWLRRILLVEDEPDAQDALKWLLELKGYAVETAGDGEEALRRLHNGLRPCVILLDLMLPGNDGFQFRQAQMHDSTIADVPVIVYSGHYDPAANIARLRAAAYFQKPIDFNELLRAIEIHCRPPPE